MNQIVAVNTMAFQGFDLSTALKEISSLGVTHVELCFTKGYVDGLSEDYFSEKNANTIKQMMADQGVQTIALAGHIDLGDKKAVPALKRRMDFAKAIGVGIVHTNATQKSNEEVFFSNMETLADFAADMEITIALENPGDGENALIDSGEAGAAVIQKIGSDRIRLNYDVSNVYSYSQGRVLPEDDISRALPYAAHVHFKDMKKIESGWLFSEIGKGVINYPKIFRVLTTHAVPLPTSIEFPKNFKRKEDFSPQRNPSPPGLVEIKAIIKGSIETIEKGLVVS
jgi:sugar phosphate isomerase/epimerase